MGYKNAQKIKRAMHNITINIPTLYDENIQKLIGMKLIASRSEAIRIALREFLNREFGENLELLGYSFKKEEKEEKSE
ncbi:MAG: ribbon-helix-helix domain-containing protein [Promethearchaeota archaeon]